MPVAKPTIDRRTASGTRPQRPEPVDAISAVIDRLAATRQAVLPDGRIRDINAFAVSNAAGALLERAAAAAPAGAVVEVGCASGLSTLHMARGRLASGKQPDHSHYHAIDPKQTTHWDSIGRMHLTQAGIDGLVTFHEQPAHAVLPRLVASHCHVGMAFIDGWHMLDYVMVEAFYVDLMLDMGGIIAIHDMWMPGLQHFACFWLANLPYEPVTVAMDSKGRPCLSNDGCESANREVGDLAGVPRMFREAVAPFVDESVLLMRKRDIDRRQWDEFHAYSAV